LRRDSKEAFSLPFGWRKFIQWKIRQRTIVSLKGIVSGDDYFCWRSYINQIRTFCPWLPCCGENRILCSSLPELFLILKVFTEAIFRYYCIVAACRKPPVTVKLAPEPGWDSKNFSVNRTWHVYLGRFFHIQLKVDTKEKSNNDRVRKPGRISDAAPKTNFWISIRFHCNKHIERSLTSFNCSKSAGFISLRKLYIHNPSVMKRNPFLPLSSNPCLQRFWRRPFSFINAFFVAHDKVK